MATLLGRGRGVDAPLGVVERDAGEPPARSRREEAAIAFFGSWMLFGLYLDGWAHQAEKPETFFSPWHGVLYSGFGAALLWFGIDGVRQAGVRGACAAVTPTDRLASLGLVLFVAGAVGDGLWHEIFGIEVDLEALLSPTHLLLLIGGFLMITSPVHAAHADPTEDAATLRSFLPTVVALTLTTALVGFFTMYLNAFWGVGTYRYAGGHELRELLEIEGVAGLLVTNVILLAPVVYALRRWRTPFGTFTILFSVCAFAITGLLAFDRIELAIAGVLGGVAADLLIRAGAPARVVASVVPLVMWPALFVVVQIVSGIDWAAELVAGSVVLAVTSGVLLATLSEPRAAT